MTVRVRSRIHYRGMVEWLQCRIVNPCGTGSSPVISAKQECLSARKNKIGTQVYGNPIPLVLPSFIPSVLYTVERVAWLHIGSNPIMRTNN